MALYLHLTKSSFCEPLCECEIRPVTKMTSIPCKRSLNALMWKPKGRAGPRQTATHLQFCLVSIHQWGFHTARAVLSCTHLALKKRSVRSSNSLGRQLTETHCRCQTRAGNFSQPHGTARCPGVQALSLPPRMAEWKG